MRQYNYKSKNELYHFGVPGMKWGVRKALNSLGIGSQYSKKRSAMTSNNFKRGNYLDRASDSMFKESYKSKRNPAAYNYMSYDKARDLSSTLSRFKNKGQTYRTNASVARSNDKSFLNTLKMNSKIAGQTVNNFTKNRANDIKRGKQKIDAYRAFSSKDFQTRNSFTKNLAPLNKIMSENNAKTSSAVNKYKKKFNPKASLDAKIATSLLKPWANMG